MDNLFGIFDPHRSFGLSLNWFGVAVLLVLPSKFWVTPNRLSHVVKSTTIVLHSEISISLGALATPGITWFSISLFIIVATINYLGLIPYVFTPTRHLAVAVSLTLPLWVGYITFIILKNLNSFLRHLVPRGTPYVLIPFMVIIEIIRISIRPLTLSVRLAANIIAGHILIVLVRRPLTSVRWIIFPLILISLGLLVTLEVAVSIIQSYVFRTLISLYIIEVNSPNF